MPSTSTVTPGNGFTNPCVGFDPIAPAPCSGYLCEDETQESPEFPIKIPNHAQFIKAVRERKKAWVKQCANADHGVLENAYAPLAYGPGNIQDGLNRYWLWDSSNSTDSQTLGLLPAQFVNGIPRVVAAENRVSRADPFNSADGMSHRAS